MTTKQQIEQYRADRPFLDPLDFPDELVVAHLELPEEADCIADVPRELKQALEPLAEILEPEPRPAALLSAPLLLVNFDAAPHGGAWKPLPDHGGEPSIRVRSFFAHSIVGSAAGAWGFFANKTSLESTFIVHKSGFFWQCMSLGEQADAQYHANGWGASAETEDNGDPDHDPWTGAQGETLVFLANEIDRLCPGMARQMLATWDGAGFGYHSMFGAPSELTPVVGKTCPGLIRRRQWETDLAPHFISGGAIDDMPSLEEVEAAAKKGALAALRQWDSERPKPAKEAPAGTKALTPTEALGVWGPDTGIPGIRRQLDELRSDVAEIKQQLE